jgi:hypothetical protein
MKDLRGDDILTRDGAIGSVRDAYFDDEHWALRYLVVDTGNWLPGRQVLISPASVRAVGAEDLQVDLSRAQVEQAPGVETHQPVSRLYEQSHALHYGYPCYWTGPYLWGPAVMPIAAPPVEQTQSAPEMRGTQEAAARAEREAEESHLRSVAEVVGYHIEARDGSIGHVEDFLVDLDNWAIADMVIDTRNWLPGKKVRIAPGEIESVDWASKEVRVRLTRDQVQHSAQA